MTDQKQQRTVQAPEGELRNSNMKLILRWHGEKDPISLKQYAQIPNLYGIVTSLYHLSLGDVWDKKAILKLKEQVAFYGLKFEIVDSFRIHEDIKRGYESRDELIEHYKANIRMLAECGIKIICYNFMPVFDWTRSGLDQPLEDGSNALVYYKKDVDKMDPTKMTLPGWDASYTPKEMAELIQEIAKSMGENTSCLLSEYDDVDPDSDSYGAISYATSIGVLEILGRNFCPAEIVSADEIEKIFLRLYEYMLDSYERQHPQFIRLAHSF